MRSSAKTGKALRMKPRGTGLPAGEAITHFARALGPARSGDQAAAQADIEKLKEQRAALEKVNQSYWAEPRIWISTWQRRLGSPMPRTTARMR
jgi:hypothetical protein